MTTFIVYNPDVIRNVIRQYASRPEPTEFPDGIFRALIGLIEGVVKERPEVLKKDFSVQEIRRVVFGWLSLPPTERCHPVSTKELTPQAKQGLYNWAKPASYRDQNNPGQTRWAGRPAWKDELHWVITRSLFDYSRTLESEEAGKPLTLGDLERLWGEIKTTPVKIEIQSTDTLNAGLQLGGVITPAEDETDGLRPATGSHATPIQKVLAKVTYPTKSQLIPAEKMFRF